MASNVGPATNGMKDSQCPSAQMPPYWYYEIEPTELENRVDLSSDQCVIDSEYYFVRGCLNISNP
jgi:hypothetical protein